MKWFLILLLMCQSCLARLFLVETYGDSAFMNTALKDAFIAALNAELTSSNDQFMKEIEDIATDAARQLYGEDFAKRVNTLIQDLLRLLGYDI